MSRVQIIHADVLAGLAQIPDESVHCVVTSPPYDKLRTYGGHAWDFEAAALRLYQVMCPGGVVCWNVGDQVIDGSESLTSFKQAIFFKERAGFRVHDTMIYEKNNFSAADSTRYHQTFEYIFVLSKGAPRTFNPLMDKPNKYAGQTSFGRTTKRQPDGTVRESASRNTYADFGKRTNVFRGNTAGQENPCQPLPHPAMMPRWLANDLIVSFSNEGDTVLDPFAGSGTTGLAADRLQRNAILIDVNPNYAQLARDRITADAGMFADVA